MSEQVIPDITSDPEAVASAARVMKEILEVMNGQRSGGGVGVPKMFVQVQPPDPRRGDLVKLGDFWISTGTNRLTYWNGRFWAGLVL